MIQILFSLLAGVLTIAAPCILPMLPILLGASVGQQSRQRPLLIVAGFVTSFAAGALLLSFLLNALGLSPDTLRNIAIVALASFGLFMLWPKPFELLTQRMSGAINKAGQMGNGRGNLSGLFLGITLGLIWTPCAGPILGSILTLVATQGSTGKSTLLVAAYALGAGIPMLVIAYGSQWITTKVRILARHSTRLQQIFGVLIIGLAVTIHFQYDVVLENALLSYTPAVGSAFEQTLAQFAGLAPKQPDNKRQINTMPNLAGQARQIDPTDNPNQIKQSSMPKIDLENYGPAPDFSGISQWLNSQPLSIAGLRGKVVLVDFWTYSCINCIRTLPYVTAWYDKYKNDGLVVIGVHTPEFAFEKVTDNVSAAIKRFGINYPVAQDNDFGTWNAYQNRYWPAEYLIDQKGNIVRQHFGEGEYDVTENAIRQLLGLDGDPKAKTAGLGDILSPEMYFEPSRLEYLSPDQAPSAQPAVYAFTQNLRLNNFTLSGKWQFAGDHALLTDGSGGIRLKFSAGKVFMVAVADQPVTLKITVDGKPRPDVTVNESRLYTLFDSDDYGQHVIDISIPEAGFEAFTFTFG